MNAVTYRVRLQAIRKMHIMRNGEEPEFVQDIDVDVDLDDPNRYVVVEKKSFSFFFNIYDESQFESVTVVDSWIIDYGDGKKTKKKKSSRERGTEAQKHGKQGDDVGVKALGRMGILQLHPVATPYVRIPHPKDRGYYRIIETEKVAGDWTGLLPNGVSVLAEIKTHYGENLAWSDFKSHQPGILSAHAEIAVALLVFVHDRGVNVMRWPIPGFDRPRCSITPARAAELDIQFEPLKNLMKGLSNNW